jgi:hypothetical protein
MERKESFNKSEEKVNEATEDGNKIAKTDES